VGERKNELEPLPNGYFQQSARPLVSLAFVLPMLLAYEAGIFILGPQAVHNGAAVWLQNLLAAIGLGQYVLLPLATCGVLLGWHHLARQPWKFSPWVLAGMLVESLALAFALLVVFRGLGSVFYSIAGSPTASIGQQAGELLGYFGAGIYEELLFRVILLSLIAAIVHAAGAPTRASLITAVAISSLIFAGAHYQLFAGSGDPFTWASFFFRTLAGIYFAAIFSLRGFGIAAGTHALYDVLASVGVF
jgi:hypothetical protein